MATARTLTVSGYFENLAKIAQFIDQAAAAAGLDERATYAIQMAVDEACTNIIKHAYGGEGSGQIRLTYQIEPEGLQVDIYDQGQAFDLADVPQLDVEAPLAERQRSGMGLFFIFELADEVEYSFDTPQGNHLRLFKRRSDTS
jgi:serine/threonine-protein kinase RsbW